jgi:hypothetical protein
MQNPIIQKNGEGSYTKNGETRNPTSTQVVAEEAGAINSQLKTTNAHA